MSAPEASAPEGAHDLHDQLRHELEHTRLAFYALLAELAPEDWARPSLNPAWSNGDVLWHIAGYLLLIPQQLVWLQTGTFPDLGAKSASVLNEENVHFTRVAAASLSLDSIAQRYEAGHAATLAALATVADHEWRLGVLMPDMGPTFSGEFRTVETLFRYHARHFAEHAHQIRPGRWA